MIDSQAWHASREEGTLSIGVSASCLECSMTALCGSAGSQLPTHSCVYRHDTTDRLMTCAQRPVSDGMIHTVTMCAGRSRQNPSTDGRTMHLHSFSMNRSYGRYCMPAGCSRAAIPGPVRHKPAERSPRASGEQDKPNIGFSYAFLWQL